MLAFLFKQGHYWWYQWISLITQKVRGKSILNTFIMIKQPMQLSILVQRKPTQHLRIIKKAHKKVNNFFITINNNSCYITPCFMIIVIWCKAALRFEYIDVNSINSPLHTWKIAPLFEFIHYKKHGRILNPINQTSINRIDNVDKFMQNKKNY
jgi:hypothetical protein